MLIFHNNQYSILPPRQPTKKRGETSFCSKSTNGHMRGVISVVMWPFASSDCGMAPHNTADDGRIVGARYTVDWFPSRNMRERECGRLQRRGVGQDAAGTHRDIARDVSPPPEMLHGVRTTFQNPWRTVLASLATKSRRNTDPPPRVKILDTILMERTGGGRPEEFFFTPADGTVRRKTERLLRCDGSASTVCIVENVFTLVSFLPLSLN